jgi:nucleoside triphosphate pyrophosphatase
MPHATEPTGKSGATVMAESNPAPPSIDPLPAPVAAGTKFILASASPRRQGLLAEAGYEFTIQPAQIDEKSIALNLSPSEAVDRVARAKGQVVSRQFPDSVVLAADTIVSFGERILGKPADAGEARAMLTLLASTTHIVITAVVVQKQSTNLLLTGRVMTAVRMAPLTMSQIENYIASNLWQGKAGGYGIQDPDPFVEKVRGCRTNVVGLPMKTTKRLLESAGILPART